MSDTRRVRGTSKYSTPTKMKLQFNDVSFQLWMYFVHAQHIVNVIHTVCSAIHSQMDPFLSADVSL